MQEGNFGIEAASWFSAITAKINALKAAEDKISSSINGRAAQLADNAQRELLLSMLIVGVALLVVAILGMAIMHNLAERSQIASQEIGELARSSVGLAEERSNYAGQLQQTMSFFKVAI